MSLVGRRVLVEYNVGGPRLYHERFVAEWVRDETYVVVTPDRDIYAEDLSISNPDIRTLKLKPSDRGLPAGVGAGEVYALPRWGENQMNSLKEEAARVAQEERGAAAPVGPVVPGGLFDRLLPSHKPFQHMAVTSQYGREKKHMAVKNPIWP